MPATIQRPRRIDTSQEKKIITAAIVSTRFLQNIKSMSKPEYYLLDYGRTVMDWCLKYLDQYGEAPGRHIREIFESEKDNLTDPAQRLIDTFLTRLSQSYEEETRFNIDFMLSRAKRFFETRSFTLLGENILKNVSSGRLGQIKRLIDEHRQVEIDTGELIDFFDPKVLMNINFNPMQSGLFQYSGNMGKIIGPYQRGWLTGILAPMKRGKTWWLMETAFQALEQNLNVLFVSLEMPINDIYLRFARRLTGYYLPTGNQDQTSVVVPVFDCGYNQDGSCNYVRRQCPVALYDDEGEKNEDYQPCTYCRENPNDEYQFEVSHYQAVIENPTLLTRMRIRRKIAEFKRLFHGRLFIRCYPAFSATLTDVVNEIERIETLHDTLIDVLVLDYADILGLERNFSDTRSGTDYIWKNLKGLASKRNLLAATASQSTRKSIEQEDIIRSTDIAEDIRKIAHVDEMFSLSQRPFEKREGLMRVTEIAHRHREFDDLKNILVLQCLSLGMPYLDSEEHYVVDEPETDEEEL